MTAVSISFPNDRVELRSRLSTELTYTENPVEARHILVNTVIDALVRRVTGQNFDSATQFAWGLERIIEGLQRGEQLPNSEFFRYHSMLVFITRALIQPMIDELLEEQPEGWLQRYRGLEDFIDGACRTFLRQGARKERQLSPNPA